MTVEKRQFNPADLVLQIATCPDGARCLYVSGLKRGREYELLEIIARMQAEDIASMPEVKADTPPRPNSDGVGEAGETEGAGRC